MAQVAVAAGRDETLPMLTGVRIELSGATLALLATDRYRPRSASCPWRPNDDGISLKALVPARTLADTAPRRWARSAARSPWRSPGAARRGDDRLRRRIAPHHQPPARRPDYPKIRSLFPDQHNAQARVRVAGLIEVVKRVALVADRTTPVRLSFAEGEVVVEAGGSEEARASEAMEATSPASR